MNLKIINGRRDLIKRRLFPDKFESMNQKQSDCWKMASTFLADSYEYEKNNDLINCEQALSYAESWIDAAGED